MTKLAQSETEALKRYEVLENVLIVQSRFALIGEMLQIIAHQWRQPLSTMAMVSGKMRIEALLETHPKPELLQDIAVIDANINYLFNTIEDFKNFFEPEVQKKWHNAQKITTLLRTLSAPILKFHNIELEIKFHDTREFFIYASELLQVLLSLVSNAKDAINEHQSEDGKIIIHCEDIVETQHYRISISDNGSGISADVIENMFEPYISTKGKDGTGVGLYMAKTIIQKHFQGTLRGENTADGSCFIIEFPTTTKELL